MKTNELMIGDWVSYKDKMPCKITAICKDTAVVDNGTTQDWRIDYDKLTPIPLTAEILEKNGFVQNGSKFTCGEISIIFTIKGFSFWTKHMINIAVDNGSRINNLHKYVHELQHALRLVGVKKEIEL